MKPQYIRDRIDGHKALYQQHRRPDLDRARRYYRGDFDGLKDGKNPWDRAARNLIFQVGESAISALIGNNPRVSADPITPDTHAVTPIVNGWLDLCFVANKMRRKSALGVLDAVIGGVGVFKTSWSTEHNLPWATVRPPGNVHFDPHARLPEDISYFLEIVPVPKQVVAERVRNGTYLPLALNRKTTDIDWTFDESFATDTRRLRDIDPDINIWEVYDRETGIVQHYCEDTHRVILEDRMDFNPYTLLTLNHNGINSMGLSEVQLMLATQENINDLYSLIKEIAYLQAPRTAYDSTVLSAEDVQNAYATAVGSLVGLPVGQNARTQAGARFGNLFYDLPRPDTPDGAIQFLKMEEETGARVSALSDLARGQIAGARTATEVAVLEAQIKSRLASREFNVMDAHAEIGEKMLALGRKYMKDGHQVRIGGTKEWRDATRKALMAVEFNIEMVPYNPVRDNPAVRLETLIQLLPVLQKAPNIDQLALVEEVVRGANLPERILIPREVAEKKMQEAAVAEQTQSLGGAAVKLPGPPAPGAPRQDAAAPGGAPGSDLRAAAPTPPPMGGTAAA